MDLVRRSFASSRSSLTLRFPSELARARTAHTGILNDIKSSQEKLATAEESLAKDWGRDWEWKKLDGTCVEQNLGE